MAPVTDLLFETPPEFPDGGHDAGNNQFPLLLSPFAIGPVQLRNRFVFQPHFTALGHDNGMPSDDHAAYHEERARGGVGLIVFESQAVHLTGKMSRRSRRRPCSSSPPDRFAGWSGTGPRASSRSSASPNRA